MVARLIYVAVCLGTGVLSADKLEVLPDRVKIPVPQANIYICTIHNVSSMTILLQYKRKCRLARYQCYSSTNRSSRMHAGTATTRYTVSIYLSIGSLPSCKVLYKPSTRSVYRRHAANLSRCSSAPPVRKLQDDLG